MARLARRSLFCGLAIIVFLASPLVAGEETDAEWRLVWSDEFASPGRPDSAKWSYEAGFIRNREAQYYTTDRAENARVENGMLVITARKERFPNPRAGADQRNNDRQFADYTSASLHTRGKGEWSSGRLEVRAKLPGGRGTWPAIWMLGTNIGEVGWPACGEIDIMEHVGFEPGRIEAHVHTKRFNHMVGTDRGGHIDIEDATRAFHVYRVDWHPDRLEFFVDNRPYFTYERPPGGDEVWPFDKPHYLILNLAIGGTWGGRQGIDDAIFPCDYKIDYVRVFERK